MKIKILVKIANEIKGSPDLNDQQKTILVSYIDRTSKLIPFLTSEELMEMDTKIKLQRNDRRNKTSKFKFPKERLSF